MYIMFHIFSLQMKKHTAPKDIVSAMTLGSFFTLVSTSFSVSKMIGESLLLQYSIENVSIQVQPSGVVVL